MIATQESITAKLCSFARAYHSNIARPKIFDDYLAYDLMGTDEYEEIGQFIENNFSFGGFNPASHFNSKKVGAKLNKYISPIPLSRISFAENELKKFADKYENCQYIICGSGMDTFSFRNDNSKIKIFELDHPDTQKYKLAKIKELEWNIPNNVKYVPIDFARDNMQEVLLKNSFNPKIPTFVAILGVTYYLTLPTFEQTLKNISQLAKSDVKIVFDYPDETTFAGDNASRVTRLAEITENLGEPMLHGFSIAELNDAIHRHNLKIEIHLNPNEIEKLFFDGKIDNQKAYENIHFISAVREV